MGYQMNTYKNNCRDIYLSKINFYYYSMIGLFYFGLVVFLAVWFYYPISIITVGSICLSYVCHLKHDKWSREYSKRYRIKDLQNILNE